MTDLQRAEQFLNGKDYDQALSVLRTYWLKNPFDVDCVRLLSRVMKALGKADLAANLYTLSESETALREDLANLCEAGCNLIDARELQLAVMLLDRCYNHVPDDPTLAYEYGFALMSLNRFGEAIPLFERCSEDFETALNLCVCHTLTRNIDATRLYTEKIAELARSEEEQKEVAHRKMVLKRLERFRNKPALTPRDWAFVLYGTVVLSEPGLEELSIARQHQDAFSGLLRDTAGKSGANTPDYQAVAWTLLVLEKLLAELGHEFEVIEFYSPLSRPLAEAMAHKLDLPCKSFRGENTTDRTLMIMAWAPNIIGPHRNFVRNSRKRVLFAYGLSTIKPLPVTPDVVGELCSDCQMPWAETSEEEAEHKSIAGKVDLPDQVQAKATDLILAQIAELESRPEIIQTVQELSDYYKPKVDQVVVGNAEFFPERPSYTAEIIF